MATINMAQIVLALALAAVLLQGTTAEEYTVGNSTGWTNINNPTFYSDWASKIRFEVGDKLLFNFATGAHTVATVKKDAYDACTTANPITLTTTGPATVRLNTTGAHYFFCTKPGHCAGGQKLSINVAAGTPSSTGTTSPPPRRSASSDSSRGIAFAFVLMSLVF